MHEVSQESIELAEKHAICSNQQSKATQKCGKVLQAMGGKQSEHGKLIEEYGKAAQKHAQASLEHAKAAQKQDADSTEEFMQASAEHVKETQLQLMASKECGKVIAERIKENNKLLKQDGSI